MKLSKKITATAAATALASAALLTPVANAQEGSAGNAPAAENENTQPEDNGAEGEGDQTGDETGNEDENPAGSSNMSKEDKIAAGIGGTIVGLGVLLSLIHI